MSDPQVPRFDVVVVGPYRTRSEAERILGRLRPCVPDAYLKRGRYLGEWASGGRCRNVGGAERIAQVALQGFHVVMRINRS